MKRVFLGISFLLTLAIFSLSPALWTQEGGSPLASPNPNPLVGSLLEDPLNDIPNESPLSPTLAGGDPGAGQVPLQLTEEDLKPAIVFVAPTQGAFKTLGESAIFGARLAHKKWGGELVFLEVPEENLGPVLNQVLNPSRVKAVVGHIFETSLFENAPYYQRQKLPVLLPLLDNWEAQRLGPEFFPMMPDVLEQGRILAQYVLGLKKKPARVFIIESSAEPLKILADTFEETLRNPNPTTPESNKKKKNNLRPLSKKIAIERIHLDNIQEFPEILGTLKGKAEDVVLLALTSREALLMAPYFQNSSLKRANFLGGTALATRDVGAAYATLEYTLFLCLPVHPGNTKNNRELLEFLTRYRNSYKQDPLWASVMAYDAIYLALVKGYFASHDSVKALRETPEHRGLAGIYAFQDDEMPGVVMRVDKHNQGNISYLP
ncbi:MAG: ABC transporter substrate-binding protein [Deltaproteobacteria bacterium]|jgi:ABC-type branched-subunit amino acid transport system substrate-binding protein|nr:ABC transporter substrate-binding protein [Deltaproteobacteria bacterium]